MTPQTGREIKFRTYNKSLGKMDYNPKADDEWELAQPINGVAKYIQNDENQSDLMQYTGLKDKNGKEIYEGDIWKGINGSVRVVDWIDDGRWSIAGYDTDTLFIIGNIHENPNLLKKAI